MVGWHVSRGPSVLTDDEIAGIEALGTAKAEFAIRTQRRPRRLSRPDRRGRPLLADPTAMAVALDRSVGLSWSRHRVAIECSSELTRGMTVVDRLNVAGDDNNREVWAAESAGADVLWILDAAKFKAMLKCGTLGLKRQIRGDGRCIGIGKDRHGAGRLDNRGKTNAEKGYQGLSRLNILASRSPG